jgi:phosphoglycerol transferase MdoB-like AlkP superfamily enzyme
MNESSILASGRLRLLAAVLVAFLALNTLVRLGLLVFNGEWDIVTSGRIVAAMAIGAVFDLGVAAYLLAPLGLLAMAWPAGRRGLRTTMAVLLVPLCVLAVFVAASEFTFWNEFASRFNFIAVDYLIYTNEVLGNLRESYNLPLMLSAVAAVAAVLWWLTWRAMRGHGADGAMSRRARFTWVLALLLAPVLSFALLDKRFEDFSSDAQANELAGNGYFYFWHAFRHNEIDYDRFYKTIPHSRALATLRREITGRVPVVATNQRANERLVSHPGEAEKRLNVVLVSIESFSAEFMAAFGNKQGLTPNLDKLATQGLLTRTVRGLEALTLSVPPTPGHAIVKRPNNENLFTVGEVFREKGYEPIYLYGGYGYFDNMNAFFSGNGYTVVDRTALPPADIHFENIWGVADEDLFTLTLRELDARHAKGQRFFAHVMTTSNHRPFTYPEGRIDIPSKTGRDGGVKYTDWAIGDFVERARKKPWFGETMFVFVADHTHKGRGRQELPPENYLIPMVIVAPGHVAPGRVETLASQIDVAPTVLGLLNFSYASKFFGHDILREGKDHPRALLANYQTVGYYEQGRVVELKPNGRTRVVDAQTGQPVADDDLSKRLTEEAVSYYQLASQAFRSGAMRIERAKAP